MTTREMPTTVHTSIEAEVDVVATVQLPLSESETAALDEMFAGPGGVPTQVTAVDAGTVTIEPLGDYEPFADDPDCLDPHMVALDAMEQGGAWIGHLRDRVKWRGGNGDRVTWGSATPLEPAVTMGELERLAAEAVGADRIERKSKAEYHAGCIEQRLREIAEVVGADDDCKAPTGGLVTLGYVKAEVARCEQVEHLLNEVECAVGDCTAAENPPLMQRLIPITIQAGRCETAERERDAMRDALSEILEQAKRDEHPASVILAVWNKAQDALKAHPRQPGSATLTAAQVDQLHQALCAAGGALMDDCEPLTAKDRATIRNMAEQAWYMLASEVRS